jgi:hypothetical protein
MGKPGAHSVDPRRSAKKSLQLGAPLPAPMSHEGVRLLSV